MTLRIQILIIDKPRKSALRLSSPAPIHPLTFGRISYVRYSPGYRQSSHVLRYSFTTVPKASQETERSTSSSHLIAMAWSTHAGAPCRAAQVRHSVCLVCVRWGQVTSAVPVTQTIFVTAVAVAVLVVTVAVRRCSAGISGQKSFC